jgi:hypothetical protein
MKRNPLIVNLPIYNRQIITDSEGMESLDFEPGDGGVLPERQKREAAALPVPDAVQWSYEMRMKKEQENEQREDEYLRSKGIL